MALHVQVQEAQSSVARAGQGQHDVSLSSDGEHGASQRAGHEGVQIPCCPGYTALGDIAKKTSHLHTRQGRQQNMELSNTTVMSYQAETELLES